MHRFLVLGLLLSGCSIYQRDFDCPPHEGVGCRSVSEIEAMIEESEQGADLFLPERTVASGCAQCKPSRSIEASIGTVRSIWVAAHNTPDGHRVEEHRVHFLDRAGKPWVATAETDQEKTRS